MEEHPPTDFDVVNTGENVSHDGVCVVNTAAVGAGAQHAGDGVGARGYKLTVRDGPTQLNGELTEGLP